MEKILKIGKTEKTVFVMRLRTEVMCRTSNAGEVVSHTGTKDREVDIIYLGRLFPMFQLLKFGHPPKYFECVKDYIIILVGDVHFIG